MSLRCTFSLYDVLLNVIFYDMLNTEMILTSVKYTQGLAHMKWSYNCYFIHSMRSVNAFVTFGSEYLSHICRVYVCKIEVVLINLHNPLHWLS